MPIRVAAAAVPGCDEVPTKANLELAATFVRAAMHEASAHGARLVVFHEGALSYPHKRKISSLPSEVGPADWSLADWDSLSAELKEVRALAAELALWTVMHAPHRLTEPNRPHNSLYVFSDTGVVVGRYDKRLLSDTELRWLYTPGTDPFTFDVDGYRFGCALCIESAFPEVFTEYAALGVDCVLYATSGVNELHLRAHASLNGLWIAVADQLRPDGRSDVGVLDPRGEWQPPRDGRSVVVAELDRDDPTLAGSQFGRHWRLAARTGEPYRTLIRSDDPRSVDKRSI